ncbi:hypothetical protein ACS5PJ_03955 [Pseudarthrobacter sp. YS3]|uniref:hypothetical protein n=1 Tax=Pseudarthrobacter sp. YS3 TaxID=3453718 RepID=UPI003EEB2FA6
MNTRPSLEAEAPGLAADEEVTGSHEVLKTQDRGQVQPRPRRAGGGHAVEHFHILLAEREPVTGYAFADRPRASGSLRQVDPRVLLQGEGQRTVPQQRGRGQAADRVRRQSREQCTGVVQRLGSTPRNANAPAGDSKVTPPCTPGRDARTDLLLQGEGQPREVVGKW